MLKIIAFVVVSCILGYISRSSLLVPGSHGFYRFFAWECILGLLLDKRDVWFRTPFALHQLLSWTLLIFSIILVVLGFRTLVVYGKPVSQREGEPQLLSFEKTSRLVTTGVYHYIRHPLFSSLMFLTWGIFFKAPAWQGASLALASTLFLAVAARAEEAECKTFFGPAYQAYMKRTKMFVPFVL